MACCADDPQQLLCHTSSWKNHPLPHIIMEESSIWCLSTVVIIHVCLPFPFTTKASLTPISDVLFDWTYSMRFLPWSMGMEIFPHNCRVSLSMPCHGVSACCGKSLEFFGILPIIANSDVWLCISTRLQGLQTYYLIGDPTYMWEDSVMHSWWLLLLFR